jgi:hypothetical protein
MKYALSIAAVIFAITAGNETTQTTSMNFEYPDTYKSDHADTLHGVAVPDPYRWLEEMICRRRPQPGSKLRML